jgi:hypothetical protein
MTFAYSFSFSRSCSRRLPHLADKANLDISRLLSGDTTVGPVVCS